MDVKLGLADPDGEEAADPDGEEAADPAAELVVLAPLCEDPEPEAVAEDEAGEDFCVVDGAEVLDFADADGVLVLGLGDELALALELKLPAGTTCPPWTLLAEVEVVVFAAADLYAASVSPEEGGLMTPAMPDWQWPGVEQ